MCDYAVFKDLNFNNQKIEKLLKLLENFDPITIDKFIKN